MKPAEALEYRYQGGRGTLIFCWGVAGLLLALTVFLADMETPWYSIASGLGVFAFLRLGVSYFTQRLRLGSDALILSSYFGRKQIPYKSIRVIRYSVDEETKRLSVTLTTMERDLDLDWYEDFPTLVEEVRRRSPNTRIEDERTPRLPA
ncbi:MAG: hypothetical protein ACO1SV_25530 [Fimbriimonas sp.]